MRSQSSRNCRRAKKVKKKRKKKMEIELNFVDELLEGQAEKLKCVEGRDDCASIYESLKEELDKLYREFERLIVTHESNESFREYHMRRLRLMEANCRYLQTDMISLLPSWSLPQEPILSEEDQQDFLHFAEWLYGYLGYLVCLINVRQQEMSSKFGNRLHGLKRELSEITKSNRYRILSGELLKASSELRDKIHEFDVKSTDVLERYLKEDSLSQVLVQL